MAVAAAITVAAGPAITHRDKPRRRYANSACVVVSVIERSPLAPPGVEL